MLRPFFSTSRRTNTFVYSCAVAVFFSVPLLAQAMSVSLDAAEKTYGPGDTFVVSLRAEGLTSEECFNAADITLEYPKALVNAVAISKGESLFTLWPEEPAIDRERGSVHLVGGVPAGYCGRVLGDPGRTNILAKVIFSVPGFQVGGAPIERDTPFTIVIATGTTVLLNDGNGTPANTINGVLSLTRLLVGSGVNEWTAQVHNDTLPPDPFTPEVNQDTNTFAGKYFLVFSAVDKQSGMNHFEITEEDPLHPGYARGSNQSIAPITGTSPYVLKDQELKSVIVVTAVDNAGNRQRVALPPPMGTSTEKTGSGLGSMLWWILGACAFLIVAFGIWWYAQNPQVSNSNV
jgi:hypothetical protein